METVELKFNNLLEDVVKNIKQDIFDLINSNFTNHNETFNTWIMSDCDHDFMYIYERNFKKYFLEHFSIETERILSYYSQNLVYALSTYYQLYNVIDSFTDIFISKQFENMDIYQLFFLEN